VCPKEAIDLVLSYEISNTGASLRPRIIDESTIEWILTTGRAFHCLPHVYTIPALEPDTADETFTEIAEGI